MLECISKVSKINNKSDKKWGRSQIMLEWIAYKAHNKNLISSGVEEGSNSVRISF